MAYSTQRSVSDGTLQLLMIEIEFFDKSEITAYFNNIPTTAYVWATDKSLRFTNPVPIGVEVLLRRSTDLSQPRHIFSQGAQFKDSTLDEDFKQILHIAQEAVEGANVGDIYQTLNMHGNFIRNVADAVEPGDAMNLAQVQAWSGSALNQADRATAEANRSAASAAASLASQNAASGSAAAALTSQNASTASAQSSYDYAISSQAARNASQAARDLALQYRDAAGASAATATTQANRATTEADRAKTEADKLANNNAFATTLESIIASQVRWKPAYYLNAERMYTDNLYPRASGGAITFNANLLVPFNTISALNIAATGQLTEASSRVWTAATFDPALKLSVISTNASGASTIRTKAATTDGGAFIIEPRLGATSTVVADSPAISFHWPNKYITRLFSDLGGVLRWGIPGGASVPIAGLRESSGDAQSGYTVDEDGWMACWGITTAVTQGTPVPFTFPKAFVGANPQVYLQAIGPRGASSEANDSVTVVSLSGFSINSGRGTPSTFQWRAYGKAR